jgi:hypothetical protein
VNEISDMADNANALVVWGSTGRRLQFSMQDLKMPESLRGDPHFHFYSKQWDAVAGYWFNRVLKESPLQHLEVERIVELIQQDIAKRWERRRQEQSLHKKRKRLLKGNTPAGSPSRSVLLTNVVGLDEYTASTAEEKDELMKAVVTRVEGVAKDTVSACNVLVDDTAPPVTEGTGEPAAKRTCTEEGGHDVAANTATAADAAETLGQPTFDDRVAVVCALSSKEKAALVIAQLHGSRFDGRSVLCRFWVES